MIRAPGRLRAPLHWYAVGGSFLLVLLVVLVATCSGDGASLAGDVSSTTGSVGCDYFAREPGHIRWHDAANHIRSRRPILVRRYLLIRSTFIIDNFHVVHAADRRGRL